MATFFYRLVPLIFLSAWPEREAMASDSKVAFKAAVAELNLDIFMAKFAENGWETYADFAFATSDPTGKNAELFEAEVVSKLIDKGKPEEMKLVPRLRRLYARTESPTSRRKIRKPCCLPRRFRKGSTEPLCRMLRKMGLRLCRLLL